MNLDLLRLLVDFGLVVLILLVQLIIYPSFTQMSADDLKKWHPIYTVRVTAVVLPLMIGQLLIVLMQTWNYFSYSNFASMAIVIALWLLTFLQAVPLHQKIDRDKDPVSAAKELVQVNRLRTFLWMVVFVLGYNSSVSSFYMPA